MLNHFLKDSIVTEFCLSSSLLERNTDSPQSSWEPQHRNIDKAHCSHLRQDPPPLKASGPPDWKLHFSAWKMSLANFLLFSMLICPFQF